MQTVTVSVEASKEAYELGQGLVKFVAAVKKSLENGWQPGADVSAIMVSAIGDLVPAMDGVTLLDEELKENPAAFVAAFGLAFKDLAKVFV